MRVYTVARPYVLTFHGSGHSYPLTSEEAQRLIEGNPVVRATRNRVILQGGNDGKPYNRTTLRPATLGGGIAFRIER
jgi:hypothetical protein